jgi:hypothetical protein
MSERLSHAEYVSEARAKAVVIAQAILSGESTVLDGARKLLPALGECELEDEDEDRLVWVMIESDTDDLPRSEHRKYWAPLALAGLDPRIRAYEADVREIALSSCRSIIDRFAVPNPSFQRTASPPLN